MQARALELPALDLSGRWRVIHDVHRSKRSHFLGLRIEFQVTLVQFGGSVVGNGEKFLVDSEPARSDEVSLLEISGRVEDDRIRLSLLERTERNPQRSLIGEILWTVRGPHHMAGSFEVDIAETAGSSEAFREQSASGMAA